MVLKRKRSEPELSFASVFSSAQESDGGRFNLDAMAAMDTARRGFFAPRLSTPSHLPSRTMKRFRDSRPSDSEVYQHTLDVLFSAQRRHHADGPAAQHPPQIAHAGVPPSVQPMAPTDHVGQQRSLHSFWNIPGPSTSTDSLASSPASSAASPQFLPAAVRSTPTNCEDCNAALGCGDTEDMMDVDGYGLGADDYICGACGKAVCFSCSVSNLGEHRRCLACAGPRTGPRR